MFVIVDIEWACNKYFQNSPTQLAAERVDENWNATERFFSLMRPQNESFYDWEQPGYNGADEDDFLSAGSAYTVLDNFLKWLKPDDVLLWWHVNNSKAFSDFLFRILKKTQCPKSIIAKHYINRFLWLEDVPSENMYKLAQWKGIDISSYVQHKSSDDVKLMKEFFLTVEIPQAYFNKSLQQLKKTQKEKRKEVKKPYQADIERKIIHKRDCAKLAYVMTEIRGYDKLNTLYKKKFFPCECCKSEFDEFVEHKKQKSANNSYAVYAFCKESEIYHKKSCRMLAKSKGVKYVTKFESVEKTGKRPCKICNPTPSDAWNIVGQGNTLKNSIEKNKTNISKEALKIIKRQSTAAKERAEKLQQENLSKTEKDDIYTLTQPGFAFFAAKGYSTFHLGSCGKIHNLSEIKGFSTYEEAITAGFKPCKTCKPTAKHDVVISIPITNQIRIGETLEDIEKLCDYLGCRYHKEEKYFYIETSVGKWRINPMNLPYRLEHINLLKGSTNSFHKQPRMFLSLCDVVRYIKRHDDSLVKQFEKYSVNI